MCLCVCMWIALWSPCLCVVPDVHWVVLKGGLSDWCSVIFSLCCALPSYHPTPLSASPVTRQWRSGCQRCGGRGENWSDCGSFVSHIAAAPAPLDLRPAHFQRWDVTLKSLFPRQSCCLFFFLPLSRCYTAKPWWNLYPKERICLSDFFFCFLPIWKCHSDVVEKNCVKTASSWLWKHGQSNFSPDLTSTAVWY